MPISAGIACRGSVRTRIALLHVSAQHPCLTCADVPERLDLLPGQCVAPAFEELLSVLSENIGDFRPMFGHFCRPLSFEVEMGST